ncbi:hypothetical protein F3Y22_tig00116937pilonHSYRG00216 [Hibiscus syriacus]|uniref:Uncharacterized protein n=1 Tax=Hibiscus syriacus TaxID=106335 RepID=A0A6A2Y0W8_HIBSY|nr:hypothetical protein F3Y22_tig00116937pilonHSYRG00216 [Hibiscus syriacus]
MVTHRWGDMCAAEWLFWKLSLRRGTDGGVATAEASTWRRWLSRGDGWPSGRLRRLGARVDTNPKHLGLLLGYRIWASVFGLGL